MKKADYVMRLQVYKRFFEMVATSCSSSLLWTGEEEIGLSRCLGLSIWKNFLTLEWVNTEKNKVKKEHAFLLRTANADQTLPGVWAL